jgi:ATP-dependent DNA helicase DinG
MTASDPPPAALDAEALAAMIKSGGAVSQKLFGFEERPGQVEMLKAVAEAFGRDQVLVVEAGTGVGKSLAYGLPACAWALESKERVVVSSATINLQEQLFHKDLPLIREVLGGKLSVVLVKGRGNYLCRRRLFDRLQQRTLVSSEFDEILEDLSTWARESQDGTRSDLPFPVPAEIWELVCSDADACLGRACPRREECFFVSARRAAEGAHVLVVNHHLLFADLALRRAKDDWKRRAVLPPFSRVILDEAHEVEDSASSFFGVRLTRLGVQRILARLQPPKKKQGGLLRALAREVETLGGALAKGRADLLAAETDETVIPRVERTREAYRRAFDQLAEFVKEQDTTAGPGDARLRLTPGIYAQEGWTAVREGFVQAADCAAGLSGEMGRLIERLVDLTEDQGRMAEVRACVSRTGELAEQTRHLVSEQPDGSVRWAEAGRKKKGRISFRSAPLDVSGLMNQTLYDQMATVVHTSATLSVSGSFDFLARRIGIWQQPPERVRTLLVDSPFDFGEQVRLGLPADLPPPDQPLFSQVLPEAVFQAVAVSGGRALVLFTSWGLMTRVYDLVRDRLLEMGLETLCQGEMPRDRLLRLFRESESSVLFGTDSFWQGVDVTGPALSNVVITRLPFDVPDEPIVQARMEAVELQGRSAFSEFMLPRAVLKLKQGFGRLVRSTEDWGVVILLDVRLLSRPYGRRFLDSLPPATVLTGTLEEVCDRLADFFTRRGRPPPERISDLDTS